MVDINNNVIQEIYESSTTEAPYDRRAEHGVQDLGRGFAPNHGYDTPPNRRKQGRSSKGYTPHTKLLIDLYNPSIGLAELPAFIEVQFIDKAFDV